MGIAVDERNEQVIAGQEYFFHFDDRLKMVIEHCRDAPRHRPVFTRVQGLEEYHLSAQAGAGVNAYLEREKLGVLETPPLLWLVKEYGVYLESNGAPPLFCGDLKRACVAYAIGHDPSVNPWGLEDTWVEPLPLGAFSRFLGRDDVLGFRISLFGSKLRMEPIGKHSKLAFMFLGDA